MKETSILATIVTVVEQYTQLPIGWVALILSFVVLEIWSRTRVTEDKNSLVMRIFNVVLSILNLIVKDKIKDRPDLIESINNVTDVEDGKED